MLLTGLLCLSLCACGDQPAAAPQPTQELPTAAPEEEKAFSLAYDPGASLHPIEGTSPVNQMLTSLIYEGLFLLDENFIPQPVLAQSAQRDQSGKVWTITLKEGVHFSDGTPFEAGCVVSSLNTARKSEQYAQRLKDVVSVRAVEGQVVITLSVPNGNLTALLDIPIVLEAEGEAAPLGTGLYRYAGVTEELYLLANYNRESDLLYEQIGLFSVSSTSQRISAFDNGAVSAVLTDFTSPYALGYSCDYEQWDYRTTDLLYVGFKCENSPCADPLVRQAIARVLDREKAAGTALGGYGDATTLPVPAGHADWYGPAAEVLQYDFAKAAELLDQAGYRKKEEDGLRYQGRTPLELTLLVNGDNEVKQAVADLLAEELTALGVTVTVSRLPWKDYTAALKKGTFDLYLGEVRMTGDFDVTELLSGSLNYGGYDVGPLAELLAARKTYSDWVRSLACEDLWNAFVQEVPIAPLCFMRESMLVRWDAGIAPTPLRGNPFFGIENW